MLVRAANFLQDRDIKKEQPEENKPILTGHQKHAIVMHRNSKYVKLDANKFPVLSSLNISNIDGFLHNIILMVYWLIWYIFLEKKNICIYYKNYENGTSERLVSIPKHDDGAVFLKMERRPDNIWIESLIKFLPGGSWNERE
jgi:hypothetical protein